MLPRLCEKFIKHIEMLNRSKNTIQAYQQNLIMFSKYFNIPVDADAKTFAKISMDDIYSFMGDLKNKNGMPLSSATINQIISAVKSFYKYLVKLKLIRENPTVELEMPTMAKKMPKFLTEDKMIALLKSVDKTNSRYPERDYAILMLFLTIGIRKSELIGINMSDISDNALLVRGKGNKERWLPLTPRCVEAINKYLDSKKQTDGDALFVSEEEEGKRVGTSCINHLVKKYLSTIGKEDLSAHKLRHSCFSSMAKNGTSVSIIQKIAGHTSISTTSIYLHTTEEEKIKAVMNTALANLE